ncbi:TIGR00341 family protein [Oculatella sp. LEGE 06141]|uniref:TIGR00341 family protein n=1 Tax=Oculatella sp. LEGE 06141 TaxID=1828648 RepID=UPI00187F95BE|nr:TIGR00341 family protein [Oculatella sp. LEGE 06141]MBE9180699.1 TIGR00341 family protein [Oculatella sp. LEGE 06141]
MSLRFLDVFLPKEQGQALSTFLESQSIVGMWQVDTTEDQYLVKVLLLTSESEAIIDAIEHQFAHVDGFRLVLFSVEASVPQLQSQNGASAQPAENELIEPSDRVNRQELYQAIAKMVTLSGNHLLMVVLSTIIAAIGLLRNDSTIIIGAMVIAPLLGPNMALSLATTLGDISLGWKAIKIGTVGIALAFSISVLIGYVLPADPTIGEIASRTRVDGSDVLLAIASGMAGALSFASGATSAIVGVMVSVALLPPLVAFGLLLGSGEWQIALGAMLLVLTNLVCLNLAGVLTFFIQKIRPGKQQDEDQAKRITFTAFWLWLTLLSLLVAGILLWRRGHQI